MGAGFYGKLPIEIEDLLKILDKNNVYERMGVSGSNYESFLQCLNVALKKKLSVENMLEDDSSGTPLLTQTNIGMNTEDILKNMAPIYFSNARI